MRLTEPNDLLHLYYKYGLRQVPITDQGEITGKIRKSSVVRHLSRSENFESNVVNTIDQLLEPADEKFLDRLKENLKSGKTSGIPIIDVDGTIQQTITPSYLEAHSEVNKFIDESSKRLIYEKLMEELPFLIRLKDGDDIVFKNYSESAECRELEYSVLKYDQHDYTLELLLPTVLKRVMEDLEFLRRGESINLRELLSHLEKCLLSQAYQNGQSITSAAELVELPRQTFNYRWNQHDVPAENTSDTSSEFSV